MPPALLMQGMGSLRLGSRAVMYTAETLPKGKNRVMGVSSGGFRSGENPGRIPLPTSAHSRGIPADPSGVSASPGCDQSIPHPPAWLCGRDGVGGGGGGKVDLTPFPLFPLLQTIQIMTGFLHIGFGIVLTTLTHVYTSVFVIGEIPFLGGVSVCAGGREWKGFPTGKRCPAAGTPPQG